MLRNFLNKSSILFFLGALLSSFSSQTWAMREDFADKNKPIIAFHNLLPEESFTFGLAYRDKNGSCTSLCEEAHHANVKFKICQAKFNLPSRQETIIRWKDLPEEVQNVGFENLYGITSFPTSGMTPGFDFHSCKYAINNDLLPENLLMCILGNMKTKKIEKFEIGFDPIKGGNATLMKSITSIELKNIK